MSSSSQIFRLSFVRPALSALIVATLALGIGSATALYSVIEAVLLRPYPFLEQNRIAILWQTDVVRNHPFVEVNVRRAVRAVDPWQPVELLTMDEIVETAMGRWRLNARLFGVLALLALVLAAVGTYSVMSYAVSRRTHEIGVRMALGAGRSEIACMVLGDGLRLAVAGVSVGSVIAFSASGLLRHLLVGVGPRDPMAFGAATVLLSVVAVLATLVPARRGGRSHDGDPD